MNKIQELHRNLRRVEKQLNSISQQLDETKHLTQNKNHHHYEPDTYAQGDMGGIPTDFEIENDNMEHHGISSPYEAAQELRARAGWYVR